MEFSIDIKTTTEGGITILDLAKDYRQYLEDVINPTPDKFEYSKSATINAITKVESDKLTLMDVLVNDHSSDVDCCTFKVESDGYYVIDHIVLPTIEWLHSTEFLAEYDVIYVTDLDKIYKSTDGVDLEECTIKEVIERNPEGTTIQHCKVDLVYTGNLQCNYYHYCSTIFNGMLSKCNTADNSDTFARDFIWMTLNIIDYLVCSKQYLEAQRIIETFNKCNGLYSSKLNPNKQTRCGCA